MSNFPNMSYCMNENTLAAMQQILDAMESEGVDFIRELSRSEKRAFNELFNACEAFIDIANDLMNEDSESEYDESMDGDFDSGMASAGFGTDEDYGG